MKKSTFVPKILLPKSDIDLSKWAVIACDQFTSEPEYWEDVKNYVGDSPSTLNMIFPEVYLEDENDDSEARISAINENMAKYKEMFLEEHESVIYLERSVNGATRKGLMLCVDLEDYDFNKGSKSKIRATEGTILDRLPPRVKVRKNAPLELPHIMLLIDDKEKKIIEQFESKKDNLKKAYNFDLMMDSGHLEGYFVEDSVIDEIESLVSDEEGELLYAVGDGNHSLATAKAIWEDLKKNNDFEDIKDNPARYALVEVVNIHDDALEFEAIYRVLFALNKDIFAEMADYYGDKYSKFEVATLEEMRKSVDELLDETQRFGVIKGDKYFVVEIKNADSNLAVGTLQNFIDKFMEKSAAKSLDYIHGIDVLDRFSKEDGNVGFYLADMDKSDLFKTVILDGSLPRKTFSMGEAKEKRFYMESRAIR